MKPGYALLVWLCLAAPAAAQSQEPVKEESSVAGAFRKEGDRIGEDCSSPKTILGCAMTIVTDHPVHLSQGSIAPQNGFGFGGAATWGSNNRNFPWTMSSDGVKAPGGAWRSGTYFKLRQADQSLVEVVGPGEGSSPGQFMHTIPIYNAYVQAISLPTLPYYGLGNDTSKDDLAFYSMQQTIVGGNATIPLPIGGRKHLRVALLLDGNGRFMQTGDSEADKPPLFGSAFGPVAAPGFGVDRGFGQFGEGARAKIVLGPRVRLDYLGQFQQFATSSDANLNFRRWTIDLGHEVSIYRKNKPVSKADQFTPNTCEQKKDERCLPDVEKLRANDRSWNRTGVVGARVLLSKSQTSGDNVVPFYFQRTLGGSDINGNRLLASYDDYRFRGPNLLLFQQTFEHMIAGPVGAWIELNQGRVGLDGQSLTNQMRKTFAIGATLNAGAAPMLTMFWATGGPEGNHFAVVMNTALMGGGSRPSLY